MIKFLSDEIENNPMSWSVVWQNNQSLILTVVANRRALSDLALVVQTLLDSAIHWINHYPLDNSIGFASVYPLDSDLSGGQRYPSFEQLGPEE